MVVVPVSSVVAALVLEIVQNQPGLFGGQIGSHPHVQHECFPLAVCEFGGIPLGMAAVAVDGVKLGTGKFPFGRASAFLSGWAAG